MRDMVWWDLWAAQESATANGVSRVTDLWSGKFLHDAQVLRWRGRDE